MKINWQVHPSWWYCMLNPNTCLARVCMTIFFSNQQEPNQIRSVDSPACLQQQWVEDGMDSRHCIRTGIPHKLLIDRYIKWERLLNQWKKIKNPTNKNTRVYCGSSFQLAPSSWSTKNEIIYICYIQKCWVIEQRSNKVKTFI